MVLSFLGNDETKHFHLNIIVEKKSYIFPCSVSKQNPPVKTMWLPTLK